MLILPEGFSSDSRLCVLYDNTVSDADDLITYDENLLIFSAARDRILSHGGKTPGTLKGIPLPAM